MLRRLFTVLSAVSLLLCVAAVVLWVRSYSVGDVLSRTTVTRDKGRYDWAYVYAYSGAGALLVEEKSSAETGAFFFEGPHGEPGFSWRRIETPYTDSE